MISPHARSTLRLLSAIALGLFLAAPSSAIEGRPVPGITRVLIVSIDGLRPDLVLRATTPTMRGLMERGSYTLWARTTDAATTLPSHTSMLTGVIPSKHRVEWNGDQPPSDLKHPVTPTLFGLAHAAGYSTAMAVGKVKLAVLAVPGTLDWSYLPPQSIVGDRKAAEAAIQIIEAHAPRVMFVHLGGVDAAGHTYGWGSPEQLQAITKADSCIGRILDSYKHGHMLDSTFVLITADHGGAGKNHGPGDPRSRFIPWLAAGPGIRPNFDLTRHADLEVRTEDTFATVCWLLGIPVPGPIDGHPVNQILMTKAYAR